MILGMYGLNPGGGGGTDSLSPPFLTKDSPWFCHLQIYSPLFSWIRKNSPLKSVLSGEFSVLHEKGSRTNLNTYNCYLM